MSDDLECQLTTAAGALQQQAAVFEAANQALEQAVDPLSSLATGTLPGPPWLLDSAIKIVEDAAIHVDKLTTAMLEMPLIPASLFTLPEVELAPGILDSMTKVLEMPPISASLFGLPELEVAPGILDSMSKVLEMPLIPASLFTLPEVELAAGIVDSMSKVLEMPAISASLFRLPELEVAPGILDSMSKLLEMPPIPASLLKLPELELPPLFDSATETLEPPHHVPSPEGMDQPDEDLWIALMSLPSMFQDMHCGAWVALLSGRPDSRRQSAHSARELIDWALRTLAPDHVFSAEEIAQRGHGGSPTRTMRVRWILRARGGTLTNRIARQVDSVHGQLSGVAHTGHASARYLRGLLRSTEGLLLALLDPAGR